MLDRDDVVLRPKGIDGLTLGLNFLIELGDFVSDVAVGADGAAPIGRRCLLSIDIDNSVDKRSNQGLLATVCRKLDNLGARDRFSPQYALRLGDRIGPEIWGRTFLSKSLESGL